MCVAGGQQWCFVSQDDYRGFVSSIYVESLDLLVASAMDGRVCE